MINSRDSFSEFEMNDIPDVLVKICEYRIIVKNYKEIINVGLSLNAHFSNCDVDFEITVDELEKNWKKVTKLIILIFLLVLLLFIVLI